MIGPVLLSAVLASAFASDHVHDAPGAFLTGNIKNIVVLVNADRLGRLTRTRSSDPSVVGHSATSEVHTVVVVHAADESTTPDEHGAWLSHALIGAYVAASATDLSTTMFCRGAKSCVELNPALRPLQDRPLAFGLVKGAASAAIAYLLIRVHRTHPRVVRVVAGVLAAGSFAIAIRNEREAR
jgi:hypothetical protein